MIRLKILLASLLCVLSFAGLSSLTPQTVGAAAFEDVCDAPGAPKDGVCAENSGSADPIAGQNGILIKVARIIALGTGVASVIIIIISGIQFVTSGGDPQKVTNAKNMITFAVVGLIVAALAQGLVVLVLSKL